MAEGGGAAGSVCRTAIRLRGEGGRRIAGMVGVVDDARSVAIPPLVLARVHGRIAVWLPVACDSRSVSEFCARGHHGGIHTWVMAELSSWARYGPTWRQLRVPGFRSEGHRCWGWGAPATHVDHLIPRARGGRHEVANLVPSGQRCNLSRAGKMAEAHRPRPVAESLPDAWTPSRDW